MNEEAWLPVYRMMLLTEVSVPRHSSRVLRAIGQYIGEQHIDSTYVHGDTTDAIVGAKAIFVRVWDQTAEDSVEG